MNDIITHITKYNIMCWVEQVYIYLLLYSQVQWLLKLDPLNEFIDCS